MVGTEMSKKDIMMEARMESSFPQTVSTHLELLKQVFINIASSLTTGAQNTSLILSASGYQTNTGIEAILDLTCEMTGLSDQEKESINELCQCSDTNQVMQNGQDTNVSVAKMICLDLGWHLEFR